MKDSDKLLEKVLEVKNELGLHARAAAALAKTASRFTSDIKVEKDGITADAKSILGLLTLDASCGTTFKVLARGEDAEEALDALEELADNHFEID